MKNFMNNIATRTMSAANTMKNKAVAFHARAMADRAGEGYIDTAVKILVAVVLGALLLAGLYALFNDTVLPTLTERITDMFDYAG